MVRTTFSSRACVHSNGRSSYVSRNAPARVLATKRALVGASSSIGAYSTGPAPIARFVRSVSDTNRHTSSGFDASFARDVITDRTHRARETTMGVTVPPPMKAARLAPARAQAAAEPTPPRATSRVVGLAIALVMTALTVGAIVFVATLPSRMRAACVALAAQNGVVLGLDGVSVGWESVHLSKVTAKLDGVPQIAVSADAIDVTLSWLTPTESTATNVSIAIDGAPEDLQTAVDAWSAKVAKTRAAAPAASRSEASNKVAFTGAKVAWTRAFGETARVDAQAAQGTLDPNKGTMSIGSDKVTVTAGRAAFGPWRVQLDRDATGTRTHVELDPVVHGGPQATYVRSPGGAVSLTANVPSSPLSRIGIPAKSVGLAGDATVEGTLDFEIAQSGASTLATKTTMTKAQFAGVPLDVAIDLSAAGDATKGLDVKQGSLVAGPLRAALSGTVKLFPDGARLALAWRTQPIACQALAKDLATSAFGDAGGALADMANALGAQVGVKLAGNASAAGLITLDSRDVGGRRRA